MNPLDARPAPEGVGTCGECAWRYLGGRGRAVPRCRRHADQRVDDPWSGCASFESPHDCRACGACCREAFDAVEIAPKCRFTREHPDLVEITPMGRTGVRRAGPRCAALDGDLGAGFSCRVYADRPKPCRDVDAGGPACLFARMRVGLTR